jgi:hypothetical protein
MFVDLMICLFMIRSMCFGIKRLGFSCAIGDVDACSLSFGLFLARMKSFVWNASLDI